MTASTDTVTGPDELAAADSDLPPSLSSLWRMVKLGYAAEPKLLSASLAMTVAMALPDALVALWLKLLADGVLQHHP